MSRVRAAIERSLEHHPGAYCSGKEHLVFQDFNMWAHLGDVLFEQAHWPTMYRVAIYLPKVKPDP